MSEFFSSFFGIFFLITASALAGGISAFAGGASGDMGDSSSSSLPYNAISDLSVYFDCTVDTNVDCTLLGMRFFEIDPMNKRAATREFADVVLSVRDWQVDSEEHYGIMLVDHTGKLSAPLILGEYGQVQKNAVSKTPKTCGKNKDQDCNPLNIRASFTSTMKMEIVARIMVQAVATVHQMTDAEYTEMGQLKITYNPKEDAKAALKQSTSKYYVQPSAYVRGLDQGAINIRAGASVLAGYSESDLKHPGWLVEFNPTLVYNYVSAQLVAGGPMLTSQNLATANSALIAKSLNAHWAVATFIRINRDPSSNLTFQAQEHVGVEYELTPYLVTNDNAFTISYLIGGNEDRYDFENVDNKMSEAYATHALSVYDVLHRDNYDLNLSAGVTTHVFDWSQWGVGGTIGGVIYLNGAHTVTLYPSAAIGYKDNLTNAPADSTKLNELLAIVGVGGAVQQVSILTQIQLRWVWGGVFTRQKDTRWQFTSDEVPNNF